MGFMDVIHLFVTGIIVSVLVIMITLAMGMLLEKEGKFLQAGYVTAMAVFVVCFTGYLVKTDELDHQRNHFVRNELFRQDPSATIVSWEWHGTDSYTYVVKAEDTLTVLEVDYAVKDDATFGYEVKERYQQ